MEYLLELVLDLIVDGGTEVIQSKRVPKFVRYLLIALVVGFFSVIVLGFLIVGFLMSKDILVPGLIVVGFGLLLGAFFVYKFRSVWKGRQT